VANVFHIFPIEVMETCIEGVFKVFNSKVISFVYEPSRYGRSFTGPIHAQLDASLKHGNSLWNIENFEHLNQSVEKKVSGFGKKMTCTQTTNSSFRSKSEHFT
jgi:hypothetical protein